MIQGRTNGELGIKTRSWIGIGSKNRTGVWSSELVLHEVITLLCTIFIFCFPFQVMHSNHSSISMHVIFLLVLQYRNQLGQASTSILSDLLTLLQPSTSLQPSKIEETILV